MDCAPDVDVVFGEAEVGSVLNGSGGRKSNAAGQRSVGVARSREMDRHQLIVPIDVHLAAGGKEPTDHRAALLHSESDAPLAHLGADLAGPKGRKQPPAKPRTGVDGAPSAAFETTAHHDDQHETNQGESRATQRGAFSSMRFEHDVTIVWISISVEHQNELKARAGRIRALSTKATERIAAPRAGCYF